MSSYELISICISTVYQRDISDGAHLENGYRVRIGFIARYDEIAGVSIRVCVDEDEYVALVIDPFQPFKSRFHGFWAVAMIARFQCSRCDV